MKKTLTALFALLTLTAPAMAKDTLTVYTYDSLVSKKGLGPKVFELFESRCHCKVQYLPSGDAGQMASRFLLDAKRDKPAASVIWGIDQHQWDKLKNWAEPWGEWRPKGWEKLKGESQVTPKEGGFLPFDSGVLAFIADTQELKKQKVEAPRRLSDLVLSQYSKKILLEDPRTSTPGTAFLLLSGELLSEKQFPDF